MNVTVMKYAPLVLVLFAVAARNSRGGAQPVPSGPEAADSIICGSDLSQGPGPFINNQLLQATPALVMLVQNWEQAWLAVQGQTTRPCRGRETGTRMPSPRGVRPAVSIDC
jgi:hypothetical protein